MIDAMSDENIESNLDENPLPMQGDAPLKEPGFNLYAPSDFNARAWGFMRAADILADHVLADYRGADLVIYPIAYLYRHQLELSVKEIIRRGNELADKPVKLKFTHPLGDLWKDCRTILEQIGLSIDAPETEYFEASLKQFNEHDPNSTLFRYPLSPKFESLDIENLRTVMHRMSTFLEIIRDEIEQRADVFNQS